MSMNQQMVDNEMRRWRSIMNKTGTYITDEAQASTVPEIFAVWAKKDWADYKLHTIVRHSEKLWKFNLSALADQSQNLEPDSPGSAALWVEIAYHDGVRIIPDTITATTAFAKDELGWWHGSDTAQAGVYRNKQDGTVWTPEAYAAAWEFIT